MFGASWGTTRAIHWAATIAGESSRPSGLGGPDLDTVDSAFGFAGNLIGVRTRGTERKECFPIFAPKGAGKRWLRRRNSLGDLAALDYTHHLLAQGI